VKPTSKEWKQMKDDWDNNLDTLFDEYELDENQTAIPLRRLLDEAISSKDYKKYYMARVTLTQLSHLFIKNGDDEPAVEKPSDTERAVKRAKQVGAPMAPKSLPRR
jgi:hypothetical protein